MYSSGPAFRHWPGSIPQANISEQDFDHGGQAVKRLRDERTLDEEQSEFRRQVLHYPRITAIRSPVEAHPPYSLEARPASSGASSITPMAGWPSKSRPNWVAEARAELPRAEARVATRARSTSRRRDRNGDDQRQSSGRADRVVSELPDGCSEASELERRPSGSMMWPHVRCAGTSRSQT